MSFFKLLSSERTEGVPLKTFIKELADQEGVPPSEIAAILLREYDEEVPFNEQFDFYYHDVVKSFVKANKSFCRAALAKVAYENDILNASFTVDVEVSQNFSEQYDICVKATEMAIFLIDVGVPIPKCLGHVAEKASEKYSEKYSAIDKKDIVNPADSAETPIEWGEFKGKATALMLISGLSLALTRSHNGCRHRNGKPNKSAIAAVAANSVMSAGHLVDIVSDRQLRGLIANALETCGQNDDSEKLPKSAE